MVTVLDQQLLFSRPWTPREFPGLVLWLAADRITGLADGDPVATWSDLSGNGRDATQATAAKRPLYKTNIVNGRPVVRFDGVDDTLVTASVVTNQIENVTILAVVNLPDASRHGGVVNNGGTNNGYALGVGLDTMDSNGNELLALSNAAYWVDINHTIGTGGHIIGLTLQDTSPSSSALWTLYKDGASAGTHTGANPPTPTGNTQIGFDGVAARYFNADIAEIVFYNVLLSDANRQRVERYLANRWGVTLA